MVKKVIVVHERENLHYWQIREHPNILLSRKCVATHWAKGKSIYAHSPWGCSVGCVPSGSSCLIALMLTVIHSIYRRETGRSPQGEAAAQALGTARLPAVFHHNSLLLILCRTIMETVCTWAFSLWGFSWETELEDKQSYTGNLICPFFLFPLLGTLEKPTDYVKGIQMS